jgi:TetR/AcrR family transcriptional repressor of lmrAB and yxaGH operons
VAAGLVESDYRRGCPVAAAAAAPPEARVVQEAAAAAFAAWTGELEQLLVREGRSAEEARSLAGFLVSRIEGALLCARAARSTEPLEHAGRHLARLLEGG